MGNTDLTGSVDLNHNDTTSELLTSDIYGVLIDGVYRFLNINQARDIIANQQRQLQDFSYKVSEIDSNSSLIKNYFTKSTDINKQILDRYRKLLDWILKGGVFLLIFSLILIAIPLFIFIWKYNTEGSLDNIKTVLKWIVGIYGFINIGGLFTWGLATFGFKRQLDSMEKRIDRIEDKVYK